MQLKPDFAFRPLPDIKTPLRFSLQTAAAAASPLGPLQDLPGVWIGQGFNVIWRPNGPPGHFLELNLTEETLEIEEIKGAIPNRGLLQADINMFGVTYLQQIKDANNKAGLHIEPGIWASVPQTENPAEVPTVVRMASIPHGTTVLAQGVATDFVGSPQFPSIDITPFVIGTAEKVPFPESNLATPSNSRSSPADIAGISQAMVDNPNSVLSAAIAGQTIKRTVVLDVSSDPTMPVTGGGLTNTAFLQGAIATGPNAQAALVTAIFWIETLQGQGNGRDTLQLQYTQTVLLNFNGLSWPHVTVGTLRKTSMA